MITKKTFGIVFALFLITLVGAVAITTQIELSKEAKERIDNIGIGDVEVSELICNEKTCEFKIWKYQQITKRVSYTEDIDSLDINFTEKDVLWKDITINKRYNLGMITIPNASTQQLQIWRDKAIKENLEKYNEVMEKRESSSEIVGLDKGEIEVKEKVGAKL